MIGGNFHQSDGRVFVGVVRFDEEDVAWIHAANLKQKVDFVNYVKRKNNSVLKDATVL